MALLCLWNRLPAIHRLFVLGIVVAMSSGATLLTSSPAQACGNTQGQQETEANYQSPLDLSQLTQEEQKALEATVAERREILPYKFLSLHRCPSLSNEAISAFEKHDYAQALTLLDSAIAEKPDSLTRWLDRAMVHYYLGDEAAARADAKQVRRFNYLRSHAAQTAYRQLMIELDGELPDPRRAVKL